MSEKYQRNEYTKEAINTLKDGLMIRHAELDRSNIEDILILAPAQEGILYHYLINENSNHYYEQLNLSIKGKIDIQIFIQAWQSVIDNNEILRTVFIWQKIKTPIQVVLKKRVAPIEFIDLSQESGEEAFYLIKNNDKVRQIDLNTQPYRITLCKLKDEKYEMLITNHHILYDGWSTGIIIKEFFQTYDNLVLGKQPERMHKSRYKEFVKWLQSSSIEEMEEYWKKYLAGFDIRTELPVDRSANEVGLSSNCYTYSLQGMIEKLEQFVKEYEFTLASLFNATWGILLQKYNNKEDVMFGAAVSVRPPEIKNIGAVIGLFINTVPVRVVCEEGDDALSLIKRVCNDQAGRSEFSSIPLVKVKSFTGLHNKESIFDSVITIENYPLENMLNNFESSLKIEGYSAYETTNYDLTLEVITNSNPALKFLFDAKKFRYQTIERIAQHYVNILELVAAKPDIKVSEIDMFTEKEKTRILIEFNDTKSLYSAKKTIIQMFEEQVIKTPYNIALVSGDRKLTYKEFNESVNRLAWTLMKKGVSAGKVVGIVSERCVEMMLGIFAVLKAGGAYLPISPSYPSERIDYILSDGGIEILLSDRLSIGESIRFKGEILDLKDRKILSNKIENLPRDYTSRDLAYIIYTSGSIGRPKGVMIEHYSVINRLNWMQKKYPIGNGDIILQKTPITFDVSVWELFWWSFYGAALYLLEPGGEKDPGAIEQAIENNGISVMHFVPSMLGAFLEYLGTKKDFKGFISLKQVFASGEALTPKHVSNFNNILNQNNSVKLSNLYGPTEATVDVSYFDCPSEGQLETVPIGKPIDNISLYILDRHRKLMPIGAVGELHIAGDGLARGYINNKALTEEKFILNPFMEGERMYKTGDLARWMPDGNVEFMGRIDHQVKIRGFRIELSEIESKLLEVEGVKEAVVIAREDHNGNKLLCAYTSMSREVDTSSIKDYLSDFLPDYMVPSYFVRLDSLPLSHNGKIDRKALPKPEIQINTSAFIPSNEIETKLLDIWRGILGHTNIGLNDNFFDIGGNSILLIQLYSQIEKQFPGKMSISEIFSFSSILDQSKFLSGNRVGQFKKIRLEYLDLPADYFSENEENVHGSSLEFSVKDDLLISLRAIADKDGIDINCILLSCFVFVLSKSTGKQDITLYTVLKETNKAFTVSINLQKLKDFSGLIAEVKKRLDWYDSSSAVDMELIEHNRKPLNGEHKILCGICDTGLSKGLDTKRVFDLSMPVEHKANEIKLVCEYNSKLLKSSKVEELFNRCVNLLEYALGGSN